jgi:hypothetical protein
VRTRGLLVLSSFVFVTAAWGAEVPEYRADLLPVAPIDGVRLVRKVVFSRGQPSTYFLLDRETHAVRLVQPGGTRLIGDIGNAPGEFYYPFDLAVAGGDRLYIIDGGNRRIQIVGANGRFLGEFPDLPKSEGISVDKRGDVFIGQPATGQLISVYDRTGKKLFAFGELLSPAALYPQLKAEEKAYRIAINRVRIAIDDEDNVWVAFIHAPIVRKFDRNGRLLAQQTLRVPGISQLTAAVLQTPPPPHYISQNFDGIQITMVIREIVFDRKARQPLLLLGDDRIVYLGRDGAPEKIIRAELQGAQLETLATDNDGTIFTSKFLTAQLLRVVLSNPKKEVRR